MESHKECLGDKMLLLRRTNHLPKHS